MISPKKGKEFHFLTDFLHFPLEGVENSDLVCGSPFIRANETKNTMAVRNISARPIPPDIEPWLLLAGKGRRGGELVADG